jgi:hypothetical protein
VLHTLPHVSMGWGTGLDPSNFASSLPLLLTRNTRGAEGGTGWRTLSLRDRTKIIWHHASKVITLYTKLQFQVGKRSMRQVYFKFI